MQLATAQSRWHTGYLSEYCYDQGVRIDAGKCIVVLGCAGCLLPARIQAEVDPCVGR